MAHWEVLDHTADLALEAHGSSAEDALAGLLEGLLAQITPGDGVRPRKEIQLQVDGLDVEECLVSVLGEVLYWINSKGWLFSAFQVASVSANEIRLSAHGEPRDPARHPFEVEIKAATYHELYLGPDTHGGWRLRVLFDI